MAKIAMTTEAVAAGLRGRRVTVGMVGLQLMRQVAPVLAAAVRRAVLGLSV